MAKQEQPKRRPIQAPNNSTANSSKSPKKDEEDPGKPYKCPMCKYRCKTPSLLSRHINHHHPEVRSQTPKHLLTALSGKASVADMLTATAEYIENATTFDERLPDDVISYLKREDAKTQLILRVIAISKVQRALEMGDSIKELDTEFKEKLKEADFKNDATPHTYLGLIERMVDLQEKELNFLKEIVQLGDVNLNDMVDKLVVAFGTSKLGSKPAKSGAGVRAFQALSVDIPDDPAERENLRTILGQFLGGATENESGGRTVEAEASNEEGT